MAMTFFGHLDDRVPALRLAIATILGPIAYAPFFGVAVGMIIGPPRALQVFLVATGVMAVGGAIMATLIGLPLALWQLRDPDAPWTRWGLFGFAAALPPAMLVFVLLGPGGSVFGGPLNAGLVGVVIVLASGTLSALASRAILLQLRWP